MSISDDARKFSSRQHHHHHWNTTAIGNINFQTSFLARLSSFKYQELFKLSRHCHPWYLVVDAGCGIGSYSRYFHTLTSASVIAVDWSFEALKTCSSQDSGILPVCADLQFLPFKPRTIDMLYTIDALGHLAGQCMALDEFNRICRNGARLFLHSECSDYQCRWPDQKLISNLSEDRIAKRDGHIGVKSSATMRTRFEQRYLLRSFFSPAGVTGWLTGYPEKYSAPFDASGMHVLALVTRCIAWLKLFLPLKVLLRLINICINRIELALGITGGGSCFAQATTVTCPQTETSCEPSVDIVIPTWKRTALLPELVAALLAQCMPNDRIFVVWQVRALPSLPDDPRVICLHQRQPGLVNARNRGVAVSHNPVLLFLDDDCRIASGLLAAHRSSFRNAATGAVAGYIDDPLFSANVSEPSVFNVENGSIVQNFHTPESCFTNSLMGANMAFRRTALEAIGGFDPNFRHNALWEDVDAAFRIQSAGYRIRYCADAKAIHLRAATGGCRSDTALPYLYHYFANTIYYCCTYAPPDKRSQWLRFWLYRLEYLARRSSPQNRNKLLRYNPLKLVAGLFGCSAGYFRFLLFGSRKHLPEVFRSKGTV